MILVDQQLPIGNHRVWTVSVCVLLSLGLMFACTQTCVAQNRIFNQPDVSNAVPQYVPRYPLPQDTTLPKTEILQVAPPVKEASSLPPSSDQLRNEPARQVEDLHSARPLNPQPQKPSAVIDYSIYRDRDPFPIDPRKPCNPCVRPNETQPRCCCNLPGLKGRPYMDKEPGGCLCGKKKQPQHPQFSAYWPRPFSAHLDHHFPGQAAERNEPCQKKRIVDVYDSLETFKLIKYQRKDNGYCGRGADPYGCLGESRYRSRVAGINDDVLRVPSDRDFRK